MIIETIMSTLDAGGRPNFAPMGVRLAGGDVDIRPFARSRTYHNLVETGKGVINIVDDVLLIVETALYSATPPYFKLKDGLPVLDGACSYYLFEVTGCVSSAEPARITGRVLESGINKKFSGFCRASFAILELAILATRLHLLSKDAVLREIDHWSALVKKTGGKRELKALNMLIDYIETYTAV